VAFLDMAFSLLLVVTNVTVEEEIEKQVSDILEDLN